MIQLAITYYCIGIIIRPQKSVFLKKNPIEKSMKVNNFVKIDRYHDSDFIVHIYISHNSQDILRSDN